MGRKTLISFKPLVLKRRLAPVAWTKGIREAVGQTTLDHAGPPSPTQHRLSRPLEIWHKNHTRSYSIRRMIHVHTHKEQHNSRSYCYFLHRVTVNE